MILVLEPLEETIIPARGETVVYLSGSEPLLITAEGRRAEIPPESQNTFSPFQQVTLQNMGTIRAQFEILIVDGIYQSHTNGSTVSASINNPIAISNPIVAALAQTLATDVNNPTAISNPIVSALAQTLTADVNNPTAISDPIVSALAQTLTANVNNPTAISNPIVSAVGKTLKASITNVATLTNPIIDALGQTLETLEKPATSLASSSKTFTAGESFTIPDNINRRDVTIMASEDNTDTVTVAGIPLRAGQYVELNKYTGAVTAQAIAANDQIFITEVIK